MFRSGGSCWSQRKWGLRMLDHRQLGGVQVRYCWELLLRPSRELLSWILEWGRFPGKSRWQLHLWRERTTIGSILKTVLEKILQELFFVTRDNRNLAVLAYILHICSDPSDCTAKHRSNHSFLDLTHFLSAAWFFFSFFLSQNGILALMVFVFNFCLFQTNLWGYTGYCQVVQGCSKRGCRIITSMGDPNRWLIYGDK